MLATIGLVVYIVVALANYSVVQSLAGSYASSRLSSEWGGKLRIASLGCNPFNHLVLRGVEWVAPNNDTICEAGKIGVSFDRFPVDGQGLHLSHVELRNIYYHFAIDSNGINLKFLIDHYHKPHPKPSVPHKPFIVQVDEVILDHVTYRQDLKESANHHTDSVGVDIPHMLYRDVCGIIRNVRVDKSHVTCRVDKLSTTERSGLELRNMKANVYVTPTGISATNLLLETADSRIQGDVLLDYDNWKTMKHYVDSVVMTCRLDEGTYGGMRDAGYWAHSLWSVTESARFHGTVGGPVADLRADGFKVGFGDESELELNGYITGLPHIDSTIIGVDIQRLHTTYNDIASVQVPGNFMKPVADLVRRLDPLDMDVSFTGSIYDFYTTMSIRSGIGQLDGDVVMAMNPKRGEYRYVGELKSNQIAIGRLVPNEWVSQAAVNLSFEGNGIDPHTMSASCEGQLSHMVIHGNYITGEAVLNVEADEGTVTAELSLDDPLATVNAHGEMAWREYGPSYRASVDLAHVDLKRMGLWKAADDSVAVFDGRIDGRYITTGDERYFGRLSASEVSFRAGSKHLKMDNAVLTVREQHQWKNLTLNSDLVNAQMRGYFDYQTLPLLVSKFVDDYVPPALIGMTDKSPTAYDESPLAASQFELDMEWVDSAAMLQQLLPQLRLARGTTLQANYNYMESFKPLLRSDSIGWGSICLRNVGVNGEPLGDRYRLRLTCDEATFGNSQMSDNADLTIESSDQATRCRLVWDNADKRVGDLDMRLVSVGDEMRLLVERSLLTLGGRQWTLRDAGGEVAFGGGHFRVADLRLESDSQSVSVQASRMGRPDDSVSVALHDFGFDFFNPYLNVLSMNAAGSADGVLYLGGLDDVLFLNADVNVDDLAFNGERLGDARVRSTWNGEMNQLNLHLVSRRVNPSEAGMTISEPIEVTGYVALGSDDPELDFTADLHNVGLQVVQPFVRRFSSEMAGAVDASVDVGGTLSHPDITGLLYLDHAKLLVDFLNVAYAVTDTIYLDSNVVRFDQVQVIDPRGNEAIINGTIRHNHLKDIFFDLMLESDELLCMQTSAQQGNVYYGTLLASADGSVRGPVDDLTITLNAQTLQGSSLCIPITDNKSVKNASYIYFDGDEEVFNDDTYSFNMNAGTPNGNSAPSVSNQRNETSGGSRWLLNINVETTPDLSLQLPIRSSLIDADISTTGSGDLQLAIGADHPFSILGDYELEGGKMGLNLLGVMRNEFSIDEGSRISFPGEVGDAMFDIKAVYSQRVNLSTLTGSLGASDNQKPIQVENVIALNGTIQNPAVGFDIRLPNADQSVEEEVFAYIDRNNERDMLQQTMSLLLFKRFYNNSGNSTDVGTDVASEGYGLVANSLGSMVSSMVQFVDVNFEYKAGNALTTDQVAVDISKEWNKFYFETTLGFGGEAREMSQVSNNNNMTGDMLVGYKINPRLHLFVFNRSNTNDYTRSDLPYKQGVGLKYTRDFDNFGELFRPKKKGKK
ncbi:MAG: translocation/assembly module TamB domain-containing protein [Bacteroidales bacterium]|nr:translocation/assembly module TamB domain-containing protein [Bacteroidales bacterium]